MARVWRSLWIQPADVQKVIAEIGTVEPFRVQHRRVQDALRFDAVELLQPVGNSLGVRIDSFGFPKVARIGAGQETSDPLCLGLAIRGSIRRTPTIIRMRIVLA